MGGRGLGAPGQVTTSPPFRETKDIFIASSGWGGGSPRGPHVLPGLCPSASSLRICGPREKPFDPTPIPQTPYLQSPADSGRAFEQTLSPDSTGPVVALSPRLPPESYSSGIPDTPSPWPGS